MKKYIILLLMITLLVCPSAWAARHYGATSLIGGGAGALDAIDITGSGNPNSNNLADGDSAMVTTISGTTVSIYFYVYDADGVQEESSPNVIKPDDYATGGNWLLVRIFADGSQLTSLDGEQISDNTIDDDSIDFTDVTAADITFAEGDITDSAIVSADIKDGDIAEADLKAVDAANDEDFFTYESTTGDFEWHSIADVSAGIAADIAEGELADDIIVEADIKAVDAAADEDFLTYESTAGDFEWHSIADISAGIAADIAEGELADAIVVEADLKAVNAAADEDIFTFESTTGDFEWHTLAELGIQPLEATLTDIADGTIAENLVNTANPWAVNEGGTGAATLTDGGVLLGSGTGAVTAMSVLADGELIVGDGTTDPVAESGATLRTSIGLGTGNTPQFTGIELGHASDTTLARSGAGTVTIEGSEVTMLGQTIGAAEVDADVATQAEIDLKAPLASPTFTGIVTLPIAATPTTDADGEVSFDTDGFGTNYDALEIWNGTHSAYVIAAQASDTPTDGQVPTFNTGGVIDWQTPTGTGDVQDVGDCADGACLDGSSDGGTYVRIYDGDSHYMQLDVEDVSANYTMSLPTTVGTANHLLQSDGDNTTSWTGTLSNVTFGGFTANRAIETDGSGNLESSAVTDAELAILDGVTAATADINIIDGVSDSGTLTAAELLYVDGVTSAIQTQIDAKEGTLTNSAGLASALSDETGTGAVVFNVAPAISGKVDRNDVAVNDDDCTGEQGNWWYDTTDNAFEFCNANSGSPALLSGGTPTVITVEDSSDTTSFPAFFNSATGDLGPKTDASNLTYNATTGVLTAVGYTIGSAAITEAELEIIDGATLGTADINIIDGISDSGSLTAAELLHVDGVTSAIQTQLNAKAGIADAEDISGVWEVQDNTYFNFGNTADVGFLYTSTSDMFLVGSKATTTTDDDIAIFRFQGDTLSAGTDADQEVFEVLRGTTEIFAVDEDGDTTILGGLTASGGNITLGATSSFSSSETASDMFTIQATGAFGDVSVLRVEQLTGNPTDGELLALVTADAEANVDNLVLANGTDDYATFRMLESGTLQIVVTSDGTAQISILDDVGVLATLTGTNVIATSVLELPSDGTVNAAGEITLDTTDEQLVVYGTAERVFHYTHTECVVVENLAAADTNYEIWMANDAVTITGIGVHCRGTCTTGADISLEDRSGNAMTHTTPTHSTGTGNTTWQAVTAANQLVAGEGLAFDVDNAVSPETDEYTICFTYTYDRQ